MPPPRSPAPRLFAILRPSISFAGWWRLTPEFWAMDLCTPHWRLYEHAAAGAAIRAAGTWLEMPPDRLVLVPPWLRFQTRTRTALDHHVVHFTLEGLPACLQRRWFPTPLVVSTPEIQALIPGWRAALTRHPAEGPGRPPAENADLAVIGSSATITQAAVAAAFSTLDPTLKQSLDRWPGAVGDLEPALNRLATRLDEPPGNEELAAACGMTVNRLIRRFRADIGQTPAQYGLEQRITAAAHLLAETDDDLDAIAAATGFSDRFHFSRTCRRRLACPPATYRRRHRG